MTSKIRPSQHCLKKEFPWWKDRYLYLFSFLFLLCFGLSNKWLTMSTAETSRMAAIESMVKFHTQAIDPSRFFKLTNDFIVREGKHYSDKPPLFAFLGALIYAPLVNLFQIEYTLRGGLAHYLIKWILTGFPLLAFGAILFCSYRQELADSQKAFFLTCLAIFGTLLFPYSTVFNNHSTAACLFGIGIFLIWKKKTHYFWAGICFALSCCIDLSGFFMSLPLGIWMLFQKISKKNWLFFWWGVSLPLILHATLNIPITGDLKPGAMHLEYFSWMPPEQLKNLTGGIAWDSWSDYFHYLYHLLIGHRGFFLHCPLFVFGLWSAVKILMDAVQPRSERALALSFIVGMLLIIGYYSACSRRFGDYCYSIRWFLLFVPSFLFYLPRFFQQRSPRFFLFALVWIVLVTAPALQNPYVNKTYHGYSFLFNLIQILESVGY